MSLKSLILIGAVSASPLISQAGDVVNWALPVDGDWNFAANWSSGFVPSLSDSVILGHDDAYVVTLMTSQPMGSLMISNPNVVLRARGGTITTVAGDFHNDGSLVFNYSELAGGAILQIGTDSIFSGSGSIRLNVNSRIQTGTEFAFTQESGHTIHGQGQIIGAMVNEGVVSSDLGFRMSLIGRDKTNNNIMQAINESELAITNVTITQGQAGEIRADGDGSSVVIAGSVILGGKLAVTENASALVRGGGSVFDGVEVDGDIGIEGPGSISFLNSFEMNGVVEINANDSFSVASLVFNDSMTVGGSGTLLLGAPSTRANIRTGVGQTVTINPKITIQGQGRIDASMINNGLISSDTSEIALLTNDKTNNARIQAVDGGKLDIFSISITQGALGVISADGVGAQIKLGASSVYGGLLQATNGADIYVPSGSLLDSVTLAGDLDVENAVLLRIANAFTNNGVITINPEGNVSNTVILFEDSMTLGGVGEIVLASPGGHAQVATSAGAVLTLPDSQIIRGFGSLPGDIVNNGLIRADGGELSLLTNSKVNNAVIDAINSSRVLINNIDVEQGENGALTSSGAGSQIALRGTLITGGSLSGLMGGEVIVEASSTLRDVEIMGSLNMNQGVVLRVDPGTINNGLITVNSNLGDAPASLHWDEESILGGSGVIRLARPGARSRLTGPVLGGVLGGIGSQQRLEGVGQIAIDFLNEGTIAPGLSIGTMSAIRPISFTGSARFVAEVDATSGDLLDSTSTIELHGALDVHFTNGFAPAGFWAHTIIEGSDITGDFDTINIPSPPGNFVTRVINTGTEIRVGQSCISDLNLDGALNFFDVSAFLSAFARQDPTADFTNDGSWNFFDVSAFLQIFSAGCP